jgi:mitochondrial fission protein ELM1
MPSRVEKDAAPVLIVSTPKAGHVNQCVAFCEAAGWTVTAIHRLPKANKLPFGFERFISRRRRMALARQLAMAHGGATRLRLVASGAAAEPVAEALRSSFGARLFAVFVGTPRQRPGLFDAAISSRHEIAGPFTADLELARNTVWIDGTLVRRVSHAGAPEHRHLTVLIGGTNRTFALSHDVIASQIAAMMQQLGLTMADMTLVTSRRTPPALADTLKSGFPASRHVAATDRDGFEKAYAAASHIAVTPDSITMVCEACASGKPVGVIALESHNDDSSAARFIDSFRKGRQITWGRLPEPADALVPWDTGAAVAQVTASYEAWLASGAARGNKPQR